MAPVLHGLVPFHRRNVVKFPSAQETVSWVIRIASPLYGLNENPCSTAILKSVTRISQH